MIEKQPVPVSMLMCDIQRDRPADLRLEVARALCRDCVEVLGLSEDLLNVAFTQLSADSAPSGRQKKPAYNASKQAGPIAQGFVKRRSANV